MGRRKKKKEGFDPATTKDPVAEDSPEVIEAVETFKKEQSEAIAELMDDAPDTGLPDQDRNIEVKEKPDEKPSEQPADQEQDSTPEAKESEKEPETKAEEQPKAETPEPTVDVPEKPKEKEPEPASPEYLTGEKFANYNVEIVSEDGARSVPLQNLVTTYQQFPHYQRKYNELKPVVDLAEKAKVTIRDVLPLLELGIHTYASQQGIISGSQPPVSQTMQPGGYQGPFKDAEQDAFYKETDPDLYTVIQNLHQRGMRYSQLESEVNRLREERMTPPRQAGPSEDEVNKAFDGKITSWSGDHTDYFTAANIGEARLNAFKNFIIKNHADSGLKLRDLTPQFLSAEFARFDPQYNLNYMQKIAQRKTEKVKNNSGMFTEGTGVRKQAEPLNEQQKLMADMF